MDNMRDYNFVLALKISERISVLKKIYNANDEDCIWGLNHWKGGKTLVNSNEYNKILQICNISNDDFLIGIKRLNQLDTELLYKFLQNAAWYKFHNSIFECLHENANTALNGFDFFIRPYHNFLLKKIGIINKQVSFKIERKVVHSYIHNTTKNLIYIAKKALIYDYKIRTSATCNTFTSYSRNKFYNFNKYTIFFNDYPVLARILAEKTMFALENYKIFINAIEINKKALTSNFCLDSGFNLTDINITNSDSHHGGKSVIIFSLNQTKLVFKFKDLTIGQKLNAFFEEIEKKDPKFSFYKISRIITKDYSIEEFVEYKECKSKEEAALFYERFGYLIGISYLLCGTDFHLENLIAHGQYPVLIDIETLFQNEAPTIDNGSAQYKYMSLVRNSILSSSLLPSNLNVNNYIDVSALSGEEQIIKSQNKEYIFNCKNDTQMGYANHKMFSAQNIPMYNSEKLSYKDFSHNIEKGFYYFFNFVNHNSQYIQSLIERCFSNQLVRILFKSTQRYNDFLEYSHHPSYLTNYLNREKLFFNLWSYPYKDKRVIKYEISDMYNEDIPIFYGLTDSLALITSNSEKIAVYFQVASLSIAKNRCKLFIKKNYFLYSNPLKLSLCTYDGANTTIQFHTSNSIFLARAKEIADYIYNKIIWGSAREDIIVTGYCTNTNNEWRKYILSNNLYDGLSGIYILFYMLNLHTPDKRYDELLQVFERMVLKDLMKSNKHMTQIKHYMSYLYIICCKLEQNNSKKVFDNGVTIFLKIQQAYTKELLPNDWLFGKSALINICLKFYKISHLNSVISFVKKVANDLEFPRDSDISFSHGIAGIIYSLCNLVQVLNFQETTPYFEKINSLYYILKKQELFFDITDNSWCNGLTGLALMQLKLYQIQNMLNIYFEINTQFIKNIMQTIEYEDCICHGQFSKYILIQKITELQLLLCPQKYISNQYKYLKENNKYNICGTKNDPELDFLTGLTGIAYEYLRQADPTVPNILLLE